MKTTDLRHKLYDYIRVAEDKKIKAIYTILEEEIEGDYDHWNDKDFVEEVMKRSEELKSGKVKGILWKDAMAQILDTSKQKNK
jgi:hypothetical protein